MTNAEAIEQLKHMKVFIGYDAESPMVKEMQSALDLAIKALEQRSSDDCISRTRLLEHLENITMDTNPDHYEDKDKWYQANGFNLCKVGIEIYVKNLPSVTPSYNSIKTELKPSEDCISRAQALHACCDEWNKDYKAIMKSIRQLPSVTPKAESEANTDEN